MDCPKCKSIPLKATKLEQGLSAMGCSKCEGAFVSLLYYRDWLERSSPIDEIDVSNAVEEVQDSHTVLPCPKCKKLMTKYKISGESSNRIDLCANCDEAWLDGGEWVLLKSLELSRKMPMVFTDHWQRKVRMQAFEEAREKRMLKLVSEEDLAEIKRFRDWLRDKSNKQEILQFISHE